MEVTAPESIDRRGELIRHVGTLDSDGIRGWLHSTLHGRGDIAGGKDGSPRDAVADIYYAVDRAVRQDIQLASYDALEAVAMGAKEWTQSAAVQLLLLADPVWIEDPAWVPTLRREQALDAIVRLAQIDDISECESLRFAATQAVITLDLKRLPRFWFDLYDRFGVRYAPLVTEALLRDNLDVLTGWLDRRLPDDAIEAAAFNLLPFIEARYGTSGAAAVLTSLYAKASTAMRAEVFEIASAERIPLEKEVVGAQARYAASHALDAMAQLLSLISPRQSIPSRLKSAVTRALSNSREAVMAVSFGRDDAVLQIWTKYLDCIDVALRRDDFMDVIFEELARSADLPLLVRLATYLIQTRAIATNAIPRRYRSSFSTPEIDSAEALLQPLPDELRNALLASLQSIESRELRAELIANDREDSFEQPILELAANR